MDGRPPVARAASVRWWTRRWLAGLLVLAVSGAGCGTAARPVEPVDAEAVLRADGVALRSADRGVVADLRSGLLAQVRGERLHDVAVRRVLDGGEQVAVAVAASFTAGLDPGIADGFVRGALDGAEPASRSETTLPDGTPLTVFRSRSGFGGAVWVRAGVVGLVLSRRPDAAEPLARRIAAGGGR